ncbi:MAG: hypothetical protein ABSD63_10515 [Candidatus Korobacteraceae bacterium]
MPTAAPKPSGITIDVTKDLKKPSDLAALFAGQAAAIFRVGSEIARYAGQPVRSAVGSAPAKLTLQGDPNWKTKSGIAFSLKADASCTIAIGNTSTKFPMAMNVDSKETTNVVAGPTAAMVYINIELDFDIKGTLSGSGNVSGIGIAGKASGSRSATLAYCQPVSAELETADAVKAAFDGLLFPFQPDCALNMPVGSIGKVNFDGTLDCELDVTYGLGNYKLSAQELGAAQSSVKVAWDKLTAPSLVANAGAKASLTYKHTDHFGVIVQKLDAKTALVYLVRSADDETGQSLGVSVGISTTSVSCTVDPAELKNAVKEVTKGGSPKLQTEVESLVPDLQTSLVGKANTWLSSHKEDAGLMLSLSQQSGRTVLYAFKVDLSPGAPQNLARQSWTALMSGDLRQALQIGGFKLQPGSGVADSLKRSSCIQFHFFNLFQLTTTSDFFKNSVTELAPDGSIRVFVDLGQESQFSIRSASETATIHFVATATEDTQGSNYQKAEVDLYIELSETNKPKEAGRIANSIGSIAANPAVQSAQQKMATFVANHGSKKLDLITIFKPSAYQKLACSAYTVDNNGKAHPPALPQKQDEDNWEVFQASVKRLMTDLSETVAELTYDKWMLWNVSSNYQIGDVPDDHHVPDRRNDGGYMAAGQNLFHDRWPAYRPFLLASTGFMNLCDDLHSLATVTAHVSTPTTWGSLIATLQKWVQSDVDPDWSKPALGALLYLCSVGTTASDVSTAFQTAKDNSCFTCTVTLS